MNNKWDTFQHLYVISPDLSRVFAPCLVDASITIRVLGKRD